MNSPAAAEIPTVAIDKNRLRLHGSPTTGSSPRISFSPSVSRGVGGPLKTSLAAILCIYLMALVGLISLGQTSAQFSSSRQL